MYIYVYIYVYIYLYNCDNNQETDLMSENVIPATAPQGEVSVTMWNFTFSVWPCKY